MAQHIRLAKLTDPPRNVGDWVETETARDITRSLDMVIASEAPSFTMISGGPGTGKTTTITRFCERLGQDALLITAVEGEGKVSDFAELLKNMWGNFPYRRSLAETRVTLAEMIGPGKTLLIDEAQYLNQKNAKTGQTGAAFEWARGLADIGKLNLVFCGDLDLPRAIEAKPQLQSRMMRPVLIRHASRADVAAIVAGTRLDRVEFGDVLHGVAKLKGGLRNVVNVARTAQLFAGDGEVTLEHIRAAILDMKLGKGSKA
jgi:hypothetical protein